MTLIIVRVGPGPKAYGAIIMSGAAIEVTVNMGH